MSITGRLLRWLGFDTTTELERTEPVYEYEILHTNGEVTTFEAHGHSFDGAFAEFYEYHELHLFFGIGRSIVPVKETTRTLESIQELSREKVDTSKYRMEVDTADNTILEAEVVE